MYWNLVGDNSFIDGNEFNENRSCIEILDLALNDYLQNFLMEIEVVYKIYVYLYL